MARTKNVFKTDEVAHLWAHRTQQSARNPQNNFFFDGDSIYSYGRHFCIARHVEGIANPRNLLDHDKAVLFNERTYSNTTARHCNLVSRAIPKTTRIYLVRNPELSPSDNYPYLVDDYKRAVKALNNAKSKPSKAVKYDAATEKHNYTREFAEFFELPFESLLPDNLSELDEILAEHNATREAKRAAKRAIYDARYAEQRRISQLKFDEKLAEWRVNPSISNYELGYSHTYTAMRLIDNGETIETSRGAKFPAHHAKLADRIIRQVRESGVDLTPDRDIRLGHYKIDKIDAQGNVTAGCHYVAYDEIAMMSEQLKGQENEG